jgi:hypothetical protein
VVAGDVVAVSSPEIEKFTFTRHRFTRTLMAKVSCGIVLAAE